MNKKVKNRLLFCCFLVLILVASVLFVVDLVQNPISGNLYDLTGIDKENITEVWITHYGETAKVTEKEKVEKIVLQFDRELERLNNDYFSYVTGGDWSISFLDSSGKKTESILFFGSNNGLDGFNTQFKIGHYYYLSDKNFSNSLIDQYWQQVK